MSLKYRHVARVLNLMTSDISSCLSCKCAIKTTKDTRTRNVAERNERHFPFPIKSAPFEELCERPPV